MRIARAFFTVVVVALAAPATAAPPPVTLQPFLTGLTSPLEIVDPNDRSGRLFIVQQGGAIRIARNGALLPTAFIDLSPGSSGPVRAGGEQGLLGLAFHPSYITNGRFFVYYTRNLAGDSVGSEIVIASYQRSAANPDVADPASASVLLVIPHPQQNNHNGGKLVFGPDGYLYAGVGDGGGGGDPFGAGQSLVDLRAKILRIDVDSPSGSNIPASNPFASSSAARHEIWDYGVRNPWRFSFDRATGDLLIADVGQNLWEEIDFEPRGSGGGRNYGWSVFEATHCFNPATGCSLPNHTPPVFEYGHGSTTGFSITGGYRYRGTSLPALSGYYVYGDYASGRIWAAAPDAGGTWVSTQIAATTNPSTFGQDEDGELYVTDLVNGTVMRVTPAGSSPLTGAPTARYRLFNSAAGDHLYTIDANEAAVLAVCCGWSAEGTAYRVFAGPGSIGNVAAVPLMRAYHPASRLHLWTADANEYASLPAGGWVQEGTDGYILPSIAGGTVPLYRLSLHASGQHLWTTDPNERSVLANGASWTDEGIAGYVIPTP